MNPKTKKIYLLALGLTLFAIIGTGAVYVSDYRSSPRPVLIAEYKFFRGISQEKLNLTASEVLKLNNSFKKNWRVVEKAVVTVAGDDSAPHPKVVLDNTGLKFTLELKGKNGMVYSPEPTSCERWKLVDSISFHVEQGVKVLAVYSNDPALKGREVTIVDM